MYSNVANSQLRWQLLQSPRIGIFSPRFFHSVVSLITSRFLFSIMRRSTSRASKVSIDAQDSMENSFPGIPDAKWHELLEKEETDMFILGLREEILSKCMEICFESYLEKQSVAFTVHCAYLAWCKVINIFYMFKDPCDLDDPEAMKSWEPDPEPEPADIDAWATECIQPMSPEYKPSTPEKETEESTPTPVIYQESVESFMSEFFDLGEGEYFYPLGPHFPTTTSSISEKHSIFTKTLSMSRESLPLLEPLVLFHSDCRDFDYSNMTKMRESGDK